MCISAWPTNFSKTITGTWEVMVEGALNQVIWYQNRVTTSSVPGSGGFDWAVGKLLQGWDINDEVIGREIAHYDIDTALILQEADARSRGDKPRTLQQVLNPGNCLLIPIVGTWESIRLLNTADTPKLLADIDSVMQVGQPLSLSAFDSWGEPGISDDRLVFLSFDVYDIVIAEKASRIAEVLPQINPEKRPRINSEIFDTIERWYQCPVAVCCFSTADEAEAKPIGFAYEPLFPDRLIVYTLDAHDGNAPQAGTTVEVDHTIFVGSYLTPPEYCARISYTDTIPDHLAPYLLHHAMGVNIQKSLPNGDIVFDTAAVRAGYFHASRKMPRYCPQQYSQEVKLGRDVPYKTGTRNLSYGGHG